MNKPSIVFILLLSMLSFSLISVYAADVLTTTIDGNAAVYICYPYDYNVTLRNTSVNERAININYVVSLPTGFSTSDPLTYNIPFLEPGQSDRRKIHIETNCSATGGNISVNGEYNSSAYAISFTKPITVKPGAVTIEKSPSVITATLEDEITYSIIVKSTGLEGPIKNVVITDNFQSGLEFLSASPGGQISANLSAVTWTSADIPDLAFMKSGDTVKIDVKAKVISCKNLVAEATARWGCNEVCDIKSTKSSINFIPEPPEIDYNVSTFTIDYCTYNKQFTITIKNTGGKASDFNISSPFAGLNAIVSSPSGAYYDTGTGKFYIGEIPSGTNISPSITNLTFTLNPIDNDWCKGFSGGNIIFRPEYKYCDISFYPPVKISSYGTSNTPSVSVTKSGPDEAYLDEEIVYEIKASYNPPLTCGNGGTTSNFKVVDYIPSGFIVKDAGGGYNDNNKTITWDNIDPSVGLDTTIKLKAPSYNECQYCNTFANNILNATVMDCCDCRRSVKAEQITALQCKEYASSLKTVSSNTNFEKCTPIHYTNTYNFDNDPFWDDVNISNLIFSEELANNQDLSGSVSITVDGCTVNYNPGPSSPMVVDFSLVDFSACSFNPTTTSVSGLNIVIEYDLITKNNSLPDCSSSYSFYDWSILDTGKISGSPCFPDKQLRETVAVTVNNAFMDIGIDGLPLIIDKCGTYDVNISLDRTSVVGAYDVEVDFPSNNYHINSVSYSGISPLSETNSSGNFTWGYGDLFENNTNAIIKLNITKKCGDTSILNATVYWDGYCNNNDNYDRECNAPTSPSPLLLSGHVCIMKSPELYWATTNQATWKICVTNTGSGAAYNVKVEDILGLGLIYHSSYWTETNISLESYNLHGAIFDISKIEAGKMKTITLVANISNCDNLDNQVNVTSGCLGVECQVPESDYSYVQFPNTDAQTIDYIPSTINMCDEQPVIISVKNVGLTYIYDVNVTANLPTGIAYVSGTSPNPENTNVNPLRWTKNQIPELAAIPPSGQIDINFRIRSSCDMPTSGNFRSQMEYKAPCGKTYTFDGKNSQITRRVANVTIQKVGRNLTAGQSTFSDDVPAEPGDRIEWRIIITNNGSAPADNVEFWDVLPTNMTFENINTNAYPGGGVTPSGSGTSADPWLHGTLSNISGSNTATYYIWGTVNLASCGSATTNRAYVRHGCDDGCRFTQAQSSLRELRTQPNITITQSSQSFTTCEGIITINVRNESRYPTAYKVFVTSTLPPGFEFDSMISGSNPTPNPPSNPTQPIWGLGNIPGNTTITLQFRVKNDGLSCGTVTPGTNVVRVDYEDVCGNNLNRTNTSGLITPLKPILSISKNPAIQPVPPGGTGSWTITVTNTGNTPAYNVTVIDTLSVDWEVPIVAGNGTNGEVPNVVGNAITWQIPGPIAQSGGTWSATLSARLKVDAGTGTNGVIAVGKCSNGCIYSSATDSARIINIQGLFKESEKEKATIGEEVVFDLAVVYSGVDANYTNTTIVDHLPDGIEYVSHTYADTYGGTIQQFNQNGQLLTWKLGTPLGGSNRNFTGPNNVMIKITGLIKDIRPDNVIGVVLVNNANTSFIQDGAPYNISDLDDVRIVEPNLTIEKQGDKTQGLPGENVHYTITVRNTGNSSAYDVVIQDQIPSGLILVGGSITSSPVAYSTIIDPGNSIQWEYLSIPPNNSVILEYDATIPPEGGSFTNTVTNTKYFSLPEGNDERRQYDPLSDDWNVISPGTDLQKVTLNTDINVPSPGGIVFFRLTITNTGAMALNPVKLIDYLPDGLTYRPGYSTVAGAPYEPNSIVGAPEVLTWDNIGAMNPTDVIIVEFQATVDPGRTGTFINNATVIGTSTIGDVTDSDDSPVGVKGPAINITKSVEPPWGKTGFANEYTLVITNTGEVPLDQVWVQDELPVGLTYANLATIIPNSVIVDPNGKTKIKWDNIGSLEVGESRTIKFSAKFNGLENKSINYAETEGKPPNGFPVRDDDQVEIQKHPGGNPKESLRIITKGYMRRCDLCYDHELNKEARKYITNQNVDDEDDTCCRPEDIIEELKVEVIKNNLDKDPRYLRALRLLDDADELCREANEAFDKGNYGQAQRLTKEKCENTGEAIRLMIEVLSSKF